uniref:CYTH domain-containing protein n=1 Tax=Parastrongyloides trichosuri TaxID=131310 RepID=A0A0N4ZL95_PARTI
MIAENELSIRFSKMRTRVKDLNKMENYIYKFTESLGQRYLLQSDYYDCPHGVIKIQKYFDDINYTKILFYDKNVQKVNNDFIQVKMSTNDNSEEISMILSVALHKKASVKIVRRQFRKDNYLINLDQVEDFGHFMTLKYIFDDDTIPEENIMFKLKKIMFIEFDINIKDILPTESYAELFFT